MFTTSRFNAFNDSNGETMIGKLSLIFGLVLSTGSLFGAEKEFYTPKEDKAELKKVKIEKDESLPNVLLVGDSISIGYTPLLIEQLKGKANVSRVNTNCGDSNKGVKKMKKWLGKTKWDVIHFNFGLHDLCYRHPDSKVYGHRDKVKGKIGVPIEQYGKNLEDIVQILNKTGATLIWASTTVVPEKEAGRFVGDDAKYNAVAEKVMAKHNIQINDLYALSKGFDKSLFKKPGDVHFKRPGSQKLADQVCAEIQKAFKSKAQ